MFGKLRSKGFALPFSLFLSTYQNQFTMNTKECFDIVRTVLNNNRPKDESDPFFRGLASGFDLAIDLLTHVEGLSCK